MGVVLSAHQPAYLPWLGYFDKIARADVFVFLDTVQFEKNSFINRNKIKTAQGPQWLTIPVRVKGHIQASLRETLTDDMQPWRSKHLKSLEMNYRKAPRFRECFPIIEQLLATPESNLAELCWQQLRFWVTEFRMNTRMVRASELPITSRKSQLILDLCQHFGAEKYLSGALGKNYLDEDRFAASGIAIEYQDFQHPTYPQLWGNFEPYMGIVDYWMNCGSDIHPVLTGKSHEF